MVILTSLGLCGRLGNQLFQVAATVAYAKKMDDVFYFNKWKYSDYILGEINDIAPTGTEIMNGTHCTSILHDKFDYYHIPEHQNVCLYGFFQSEKYFEHAKEKIKSIFSPNEKNLPLLADFLIKKKNNTVAIHVRRGDFLLNQGSFPLQSIEYYLSAIEKVCLAENGPLDFYIFSDDLTYVKNELIPVIKEKFPDNNYFLEDIFDTKNDIELLYIMAAMKHIVIANSTYSWWAAWISQNIFENNGIVVAPKTWIGPEWRKLHPETTTQKDIYCQGWIVI